MIGGIALPQLDDDFWKIGMGGNRGADGKNNDKLYLKKFQ